MSADNILKKQRKSASNVKLTKEATRWAGTYCQTPARHLRNTTFVYEFGKQPENSEYAYPAGPQRGIKAPK